MPEKKRFGARFERAAQCALDRNNRLSLLFKPMAFAFSFYDDGALEDFLRIFQDGRDRDFLGYHGHLSLDSVSQNFLNGVGTYTEAIVERVYLLSEPIVLPSEAEIIQKLAAGLDFPITSDGRGITQLKPEEFNSLLMDLVTGKQDSQTTRLREGATKLTQYVDALVRKKQAIITQHNRYEKWHSSRILESSLESGEVATAQEYEENFYTQIEAKEIQSAEVILMAYKKWTEDLKIKHQLFFWGRINELESRLHLEVVDELKAIIERKKLVDTPLNEKSEIVNAVLAHLFKATDLLMDSDLNDVTSAVFGTKVKEILEILQELDSFAKKYDRAKIIELVRDCAMKIQEADRDH